MRTYELKKRLDGQDDLQISKHRCLRPCIGVGGGRLQLPNRQYGLSLSQEAKQKKICRCKYWGKVTFPPFPCPLCPLLSLFLLSIIFFFDSPSARAAAAAAASVTVTFAKFPFLGKRNGIFRLGTPIRSSVLYI
ncbi:hypothetical protein F4775DRAFT_540510 [Biscogniauxia sp. FL1348]|nr:hypothetical protein F4775DRAFT_540510 [Biscogniauxia sp. FL1348]